MATPEDILTGLAQAMADEVSQLTEALDHEADPVDNTVKWPHGEIIIVSNNRYNPWNTDKVDTATDNQGNEIGHLVDARWDAEMQLNIWLAVPSEDYDIQPIATALERGFRRYDQDMPNPDPLPDGQGGTLDDVAWLRIVGGGELPTASNNQPPLRGAQITVELRWKDRIDTSQAYEELDYIDTVDIPNSGDLTDTDATDEIAIEYKAS